MDNVVKSSRSAKSADHSVRLRFDFDGEDYKLVAAYRIQKRPPRFEKPADRFMDPANMAGFWVEVRTDQDELVYFKAMAHPLAHLGEAPAGEDDDEKIGSYERSTNVDLTTTFSILVPEFASNATVRLMGSPHGPQGIVGAVATVFEASGIKLTDPPKPTTKGGD